MENKQVYNEFSSYLSSDMADNERLELEEKIKKDPEISKHFILSKMVWEDLSYSEKARNEIIIKKTFKKIHHRTPSILYQFRLYAAVFLAVVGITAGFLWFQKDRDKEMITVQTGVGEIRNFALEDGTLVWLNAQSTLQYPEHFSRESRSVSLSGEAYFEVKSNKERPFVVDSKNITVNVLGTHFNVSAYANDPFTSVFLKEGRVIVGNKENGGNYIIIPNQTLTYHKPTQNVSVSISEEEYLTAWRNGDLYFYNEKFESIARKLERKFGKKIFIQNESIKFLNYTAEFENESLDEILMSLNCTHTMNIRKTEDGYILSEK